MKQDEFCDLFIYELVEWSTAMSIYGDDDNGDHA